MILAQIGEPLQLMELPTSLLADGQLLHKTEWLFIINGGHRHSLD